jgi:hypothetical protein
MAVTKVNNTVNISDLHEYCKIEFICPICKFKKVLQVPKSVINKSKQLTTVSIARGLVCEHQFQAFIDKNFKVRGYQKVDFEFENNIASDNNDVFKYFSNSDDKLFNSLIMEENFLEYKPKKLKISVNHTQKNRNMTLKEIYEEFWELIDDDNEQFTEFIKTDVRRNKLNNNISN